MVDTNDRLNPSQSENTAGPAGSRDTGDSAGLRRLRSARVLCTKAWCCRRPAGPETLSPCFRKDRASSALQEGAAGERSALQRCMCGVRDAIRKRAQHTHGACWPSRGDRPARAPRCCSCASRSCAALHSTPSALSTLRARSPAEGALVARCPARPPPGRPVGWLPLREV